MDSLKAYIKLVEEEFLPNFHIESTSPSDPVKVLAIPDNWISLGSGNFASVAYHVHYPEMVVKVYAPNRDGLHQELEVYKKIGNHPAYSTCYHHGCNYLILKRLKGDTFYDCLKKGIKIPKKAVADIDAALKYAKKRGLNPRDVHIKNVMLINGRGVVLDISEFGKIGPCHLWRDVKKAYFKAYLPFWYKCHFPIPEVILNLSRKSYQIFKRKRKS